MKYIQLRDNKAHLLMVLAMLLGLGVLTITLVSFYGARAALRQSAVAAELPLAADAVYAEIQRDAARPLQVASMMARDSLLRDWVAGGEKNPVQVARYLQEVQSHYSAMTAAFISEVTRNHYQASGALKQVRPQVPRDAWYFRLQNQADAYELQVEPDAANRERPTVFANYRVYDDARRFIGVARVGLALESVLRTMDDYQQRLGVHVYFADDTGRIVLGGAGTQGAVALRMQDIPGLGELAADLLVARKGSFEYQSAGQKYLVQLRPVPELKGSLWVVKREGQGLAPLRNSLYLGWLLGLVMAAAVLLLVYRVVSSYQRPPEKLAATDSLTGLASREALEVLLRQSMLEASRLRSGMAAVLLDLDHFKDLNDSLGLMVGDRVLSDMGVTLKANLRSSDIACRWGGEEFLVLLKDADLAEAVKVAENLRSAIAERQHGEDGNTVIITASLGVAAYRAGESQETFIGRAEDALLRAKQDGRNRVRQEFASPLVEAPAK